MNKLGGVIVGSLIIIVVVIAVIMVGQHISRPSMKDYQETVDIVFMCKQKSDRYQRAHELMLTGISVEQAVTDTKWLNNNRTDQDDVELKSHLQAVLSMPASSTITSATSARWAHRACLLKHDIRGY